MHFQNLHSSFSGSCTTRDGFPPEKMCCFQMWCVNSLGFKSFHVTMCHGLEQEKTSDDVCILCQTHKFLFGIERNSYTGCRDVIPFFFKTPSPLVSWLSCGKTESCKTYVRSLRGTTMKHCFLMVSDIQIPLSAIK